MLKAAVKKQTADPSPSGQFERLWRIEMRANGRRMASAMSQSPTPRKDSQSMSKERKRSEFPLPPLLLHRENPRLVNVRYRLLTNEASRRVAAKEDEHCHYSRQIRRSSLNQWDHYREWSHVHSVRIVCMLDYSICMLKWQRHVAVFVSLVNN